MVIELELMRKFSKGQQKSASVVLDVHVCI
jgi:hypothetical protein